MTIAGQIYLYIGFAFIAVFVLAHESISLMLRIQETLTSERPSAATMNDENPYIYGGLLPEDLLRIKVISATVLGGLGLIMVFLQLSQAEGFGFVIIILTVLIFLVVFYVSFSAPDTIVKMLYERKMEKMNRQLVDAMNVLALALRSGKTFEAALPLVAEEIPQPLAGEFDRVVQEMQVGGIPVDAALQRMANRLPFKDMQIFVSSTLIVNRIGGSQADILDRSSDLIRQRFLIMQKCKALTAEGRFTALAISLAPVFILFVNLLINYEMASQFVTHPVGILVLVGIGISDFIGYKILSRITRSEF
ncbi:MAG: type II secretion system F family protein [Candidatus Sumerlaeota bacterium]